MTLPSHNPPQAEPPKPNTTWTLMPPPLVAFQMWVDGSVKIVFSPDKAGEVVECFRQHLKAFEVAEAMIKNPPKKCVGCRGSGQIMVKNGEQKEPTVCPKCSGSGRMNFIPPNLAPSPSSSVVISGPPPNPFTEDDEPPKVELPHQTLQPVDLDGELMPQMQRLLAKHGYKVVALSKEETAEQLAELTAANASNVDHSETERPPATEETAPILSLEELAALGKPSH